MTKKKISKTTKEVMRKIEKGQVKMKPKAYFVLGSMMLGAGIVGVLLLTVFLSGAVFFHLRVGRVMHFLGYGKPGLNFFVRAFPWRVVGLSVLGFVGGSYLVKKHDKSYRVGLGWLVLGAVVTVIGLGFLMDRVGVNERLEKRKEFRPLYQQHDFKDKQEMMERMKRMSPPPRPGAGKPDFDRSRMRVK